MIISSTAGPLRTALRPKFRRIFYTPGNNEMWITPLELQMQGAWKHMLAGFLMSDLSQVSRLLVQAMGYLGGECLPGDIERTVPFFSI